MNKEAIAQAILDHLSNRLAGFWEDVSSGEFPQDRTIHIQFNAATIDRLNERLLAAARERLNLTLALLQQSALDPARLDQFAKPYLEEAREEVEREYDDIEGGQNGFSEGRRRYDI
jgi:hypothetical protein